MAPTRPWKPVPPQRTQPTAFGKRAGGSWPITSRKKAASAGVAAAVGFALFFGGRVDDIKVRRGTSAGQMVH